jgi:hypothetical protein
VDQGQPFISSQPRIMFSLDALRSSVVISFPHIKQDFEEALNESKKRDH